MNDFALVLIWLGAFAMVVLSIYFYMKYRAQAPIEVIRAERRFKFSINWKKIGVVVMGIGLACFFISILKTIDDLGVFKVSLLNEMTGFGSILLFTGLSFFLAQRVDRNDSIEK